MQSTVTEDRNLYIGGSDIPAILGISRFTTRWELLQYKAGIKENTFTGNIYTEYGNTMEPKIRDWVNETWDCHFEETKIVMDDSEVLPTRYHADGDDTEEGELLEIKTTSRIARKFDAVSKDIPWDEYQFEFYKAYYSQLLYGMWAYGYKIGWLQVYARPDDMSEEFDEQNVFGYRIEMDNHKDFLEEILKEVDLFRQDFIYLKEHPDISESELPSRNTLMQKAKGVIKIGGASVPISWLLANKKEITDTLKSVSQEFLTEMQNHHVKTVEFADLGVKLTYVAKGDDTIEQVFDEKTFKEDNPDMWRKYLVEKTKKGKASSVRVTRMAEREKA